MRQLAVWVVLGFVALVLGPSARAADGRELLTTGYNGYAVVWNIEPDKRSAEALIAEVAKRSPWRLVNGELDLTNR